MILSKKIFLISLLFISTNCFSNICVNTSSNYKMFGAELRTGILFQGQKLAFADKNFKEYQAFSVGNTNELSNQIHQMNNNNCSILLGFFTSSDCLIAGPMLYKNKIVGISPSCSTDKITQFYPYLYTAVPPLNKFNKVMINHLNNKLNLGKIFFIYQPTDIYSTLSYENVMENFHKNFTTIPLGSDGDFDLNLFSFGKNETVTFVFFTYPVPSAQMILSLSNAGLLNKNVNIIGAPSWVFDVSVFRPIKKILENVNSVVSVDVLNWPQISKSTFTQNFVKRFNREPLTIELLNYDVTRLSIDCYQKSLVNGVYNVDLFEACILSSPYQGVSGTFSFTKGSPFANRSLQMNNFFDRIL